MPPSAGAAPLAQFAESPIGNPAGCKGRRKTLTGTASSRCGSAVWSTLRGGPRLALAQTPYAESGAHVQIVLSIRRDRASAGLMRLRSHVALVRILLDELDRVTLPGAGARVATGVAEHLTEEVARLGRRILECAAAMTDENEESSNWVAASVSRRPGE